MANTKAMESEEEIALYDAVERAIINIRAALAEIERVWVWIAAERPNPTTTALTALESADEILNVAREDLARARSALVSFTQFRSEGLREERFLRHTTVRKGIE
jgi:hypothetical protein